MTRDSRRRRLALLAGGLLGLAVGAAVGVVWLRGVCLLAGIAALGLAYPRQARRVLAWWPTRLVIGVSALAFAAGVSQRDLGLGQLTTTLLATGLAVLTYVAFVSIVERRWPTELDPKKAPLEALLGVALGLVSTGLLIATLTAGAHGPLLPGTRLLGSLVVTAVLAGVWEELAFRGIVFRILRERWGVWVALITSSWIFSFLHADQKLDTFLAGVNLGLLFVVTRRLWMSITGHAVHNLISGLVAPSDPGFLERFGDRSPLEWTVGLLLHLATTTVLICLAVRWRRLDAVLPTPARASPGEERSRLRR